jgi:hypothetical protein
MPFEIKKRRKESHDAIMGIIHRQTKIKTMISIGWDHFMKHNKLIPQQKEN